MSLHGRRGTGARSRNVNAVVAQDWRAHYLHLLCGGARGLHVRSASRGVVNPARQAGWSVLMWSKVNPVRRPPNGDLRLIRNGECHESTGFVSTM
jgi:hypothetical protein